MLPCRRPEQHRRRDPLDQRRRADEQQRRAGDVAPLAQQQREEQPDAQQLECAVRAFDHRRREVRRHAGAAAGRRGSYIVANSGMPGFTCTTSQITSSAIPRSPTVPGRNHRSRIDAIVDFARGERDSASASAAPEGGSRRVGQQVGDAGVARRKKHLQRFHRERQQRAGDYRDGQAAGRRAAALRGCDKETERKVRDEVADEVVAHPARRPGGEQEERRPGAPLQPRLERLQARVEDREAVEPGEEYGSSERAGAGRQHAGPRVRERPRAASRGSAAQRPALIPVHCLLRRRRCAPVRSCSCSSFAGRPCPGRSRDS